MSDHPHVKLGKYVEPGIPVYPQPPKRITKRLGRIADAFDIDSGDETLSEDDIKRAVIGNLGERIYFLFETFIPNLPQRLPEWEFWGYTDPDAFHADDFDEDNCGNAATFPQWLEAIDVIVEVNGGKRFLALLGKVVPEGWLKVKIAEVFETGQEALERWNGSQNSRGESGTSDPKTSGPTDPTSAGSSPEQSSGNGSPTPVMAGSTPST